MVQAQHRTEAGGAQPDRTQLGLLPGLLSLWLQVLGLEICPKLGREVRAFEGEVDGGLQKAELSAGVMSGAGEHAGVDRTFVYKAPQAVGQLDLTAGVLLDLLQGCEDIRRQDVASDDGEVRRRALGLWFLYQVADFEHAVADRFGVNNAVAAHSLASDALDEQNRPIELGEEVDHLFESWRVGIDHVIGEQNGERILANRFFGAEDRVTEPERLLLVNRGDVDHRRERPNGGEQVGFATFGEQRFQRRMWREVGRRHGVTGTGNEDDVTNTRTHGFLDAVLDDGAID